MKATNRPRESKKSSVLPFPTIRELFPKKDVQIIRKKKQPIFAQKRNKEQAAQQVVMFDVL